MENALQLRETAVSLNEHRRNAVVKSTETEGVGKYARNAAAVASSDTVSIGSGKWGSGGSTVTFDGPSIAFH